MSKRVSTPIFIILALSIFCSLSFACNLTLNNTPTQVYFSPRGGCAEGIVKEIDNATIIKNLSSSFLPQFATIEDNVCDK